MRTGFLEDNRYQRLVEHVSELWMRGMIEMARTYGWRKRELLKLRVGQVDLKARTIRLDPGTTKNRAGREITMTANVAALLEQCVNGKAPEEHVFTRDNGQPVRDFRKAWYKLCVLAGVGQMLCRACDKVVTGKKCECASPKLRYSGLILHDMRRTAARNLRRAGVPEGVIQKIGGWKTRSVFERYNIVSQADIADAINKLEEACKQSAVPEVGHDFGHDSPSGRGESGNARSN